MSKVILISSSKSVASAISKMASQQGCQFEHYATEEHWHSNNSSFNNVIPFHKNHSLPSGQKEFHLPQKSLNEIQFETINQALLKMRGNVSKVSRILRVGRATLYRKIKEYGIDVHDIRKQAKKQKDQNLAA